MNLLRQSTSQVIRFGPFLDSTDGVTPETALTIAQADMQLSKDGATFALKNTTGNATHDTDGWYSTTLDTTDTATNAILLLQVTVSGALPVWHEYYVVPQTSYDALTTNGLNNFSASSDTVANVTTVATTTTNTDMVGTDNAATATALATVDTNVDAIKVKTDFLPSVIAGGTGGVFIAGTNAATTVTTSFTTTFTGNLSGNVVGSTGSVTAGVTVTTNNDKSGYSLTQSFPTNFASQVISASGAVDSLTQGYLNTLLTEVTTGRIAGNFDVFFENADALTTKVVDDVGTGSGTGLTAQQTRDAMKLAPTAGTPATGSIDLHLDDILEDTGTTLPATLATLSTATALATVDTNVDAILVDTGTTIPATLSTLSTATALATAQLDLNTITGSDGATLATSQPNEDFGAVRKNATFSNFTFLMVLTSDHVTPATGLTVTGQRSINGGAFAGVSGTITEISNGIYQFDALAADTNGDTLNWRFSSATADDTFLTIKTVA